MMTRHPLFLFVLLLVLGIDNNVNALSTFWAHARQTKQLSELRSSSRQQTQSSVADPLIALPFFMPLCGNGRIDTRVDYADYNKQNPDASIQMTKMQITGNKTADPTTMYNITMEADEECDDGNRIDFDGCSADCMYIDLWAPACEMAVNTSLVYEDIIYDPVRQAILVSAQDGIYELETNTDDGVVHAKLLVSKNFVVTNIFRYYNHILIISLPRMYYYALVDGGSEIIPISGIGGYDKTMNTEWRAIPVSNTSYFMRYVDTILWFTGWCSLTYDTISICPGHECYVGMDIGDKMCNLMYRINETTVLIGCGNVRITVGSFGVGNDWTFICKVERPYEPVINMNGTLWSDIFESIAGRSMPFHIVQKESLIISPPLLDVKPSTSIQAYHPLGGFIETTLDSARKLGALDSRAPIVYIKGEPTLLPMLMSITDQPNRTCGSDMCLFDNDPFYDPMQLNSLSKTSSVNKRSWNSILQEQIDLFSVSNLYDLKTDEIQYTQFLNAFRTIYEANIAPLRVIAMLNHPATHNIWAIRKDSLIEVSKTGTLISRSDGKCVPSGVALCNPCMWAKSGQPCQSCSNVGANENSWAWRLSCRDCSISSGSRRLLMAQTEVSTTISFSVTGNFSLLVSIWPTAILQSNPALISVSIITTDPVTEMRRIKVRLQELLDVRVVIPPYIIIPIVDNPIQNSISTISIIVLSIVLVFVVIGLIVCVFYKYHHDNGHNNKTKSKKAAYTSVGKYDDYTFK